MPPEKRNAYLEADESDEDDVRGYDSEADEVRKGGARSAKRRKLEDRSDEDEDSGGESDDGGTRRTDAVKPGESGEDEEDEEEGEEEKEEEDNTGLDATAKSKKKKTAKDLLPDASRPLSKKNLVATEAAVKRSGVVYLSRIPPYLKPAKLRQLLEPWGAVNRLYLAPEDPVAHARRVRAGGNKKRSYTEGWVEFVDKKDAKKACELLNARTIGGKKGSYYRDDIWNLVYLHRFKWHHLTEQIAAENKEREHRMRAEISRTTRENREFLRNVERAKMLDGIEAKRAQKQRRQQPDGEEAGDSAMGGREKEKWGRGGEGEGEGESAHSGRKSVRTFRQIPLVRKEEREEQPEQVQRVLSKIF